jgi:hypothetical protein
MKKSVPVKEITRTLRTAQSGLESLLSGQQDLHLNTGSSSVSEYAGTSVTSTTRSDVSRRKVSQASRTQLEKIVKLRNFIVDSMIVSGNSNLIPFCLDCIQREYSERLLLYRSLLKTSRKLEISPLKAAEYLRFLEVSQRALLCDMAPTSPNGVVTTPPSPRTGQRRTKKRSRTRVKRSGRGK